MKWMLALLMVIPALASAANLKDLYKDNPSRSDLSKPTAVCGDVLYFDFGAAVDGPAYYTDREGNILCHAGGQCRGSKAAECRDCLKKLNPKCGKSA